MLKGDAARLCVLVVIPDVESRHLHLLRRAKLFRLDWIGKAKVYSVPLFTVAGLEGVLTAKSLSLHLKRQIRLII